MTGVIRKERSQRVH